MDPPEQAGFGPQGSSVMRQRRFHAACVGFGLSAIVLGGCQEGASLGGGARIVAPGVPIAVESIAGAPDGVTTRFSTALASEASARQVELVGGDNSARYRVRGYLSAEPTEDGSTALAFVWDVFDSQKKRAQRVQGASVARAKAGENPWDTVDQTTVSKAASESMDAIAGFLTTSPSMSASAPAAAGGTAATQRRATLSQAR
jgi:hypothetical protein